MLGFMKFVMPFVVVAIVFNYIWGGLGLAVVVGLRLLVVSFLTYMVSGSLTAREVGEGVSGLLLPLRVFRVDTERISVVVAIAVSLVPVLRREARDVSMALRVKGFDLSLRNLVWRPDLFVLGYFRGVFRRVEVIERALIVKGYE